MKKRKKRKKPAKRFYHAPSNAIVSATLFQEACQLGLAMHTRRCDECDEIKVTVPILVRYSRERARVCASCLPGYRKRVNARLAAWALGIVMRDVEEKQARLEDIRGAPWSDVSEGRTHKTIG